MADGELAGIGVLVTRPRHQATGLVDAIVARGGNAIAFPVMEIRPCTTAAISDAVEQLRDPDITIFVSVNAVENGLAQAGSARIAAIGPATAAAIEAGGHSIDIRSAAGYNSEHLLAEPELHDVSGKVVRIIRGTRGRELLAETLRARGAIVDYLSVYEQQLPDYATAELDNLEQQWRAGEVNVVTIMSVESLHNLVRLLPEWCVSQLVDTPLVTPATRVIKEAREQFPGLPATLARGPQAGDMVDAIIACTQT